MFTTSYGASTSMSSSDSQLLQALLLDLDDGFKDLVEEYDGQLRSYAAGLTRRKEDVDDAMQESWLKAYQALNRYSQERIQELQLKPWLFRIVHNEVMDLLPQKKNVSRIVSIDIMREVGEEIEDKQELRPEYVFELGDRMREVGIALEKLPDVSQNLLKMHLVEHLDHKEIAYRLQRPVKSVQTSLYRALGQLRNKLANVS